MYVQNPHWKFTTDLRRKQSHEACQANQLDAAALQFRDQLPVVVLARDALRGNPHRRQSSLARNFQTPRILSITNPTKHLPLHTPPPNEIPNPTNVRPPPP